MKRTIHILVLLAILLGTPALCAWLGGYHEIWEGVKSFPPRTEDWGLHPEKLWNHRCPFSWPWFVGMAVFTFACLRPLVRRALKPSNRQTVKSSNRQTAQQSTALPHHRTFPWWGWAGLAELAVAWVFCWAKFECCRSIQPHISYAPLWLGYILVMNALCVLRSGSSPLTRHTGAYLLTFPASALFWWFFEYLNRYVWNWYYLGVSQMSAGEYTFYATLCFSSVLPAVTATAAFLHTFAPFDDRRFADLHPVDLRRWRPIALLSFVAALGLSGIVFFPQYAFPLLWLSPLMVFLLIQAALGEPSLLALPNGRNWALVLRFAAAALVCGLCWETWNYYAVAKWVYSVPYVQRFQIWEMPIIGFAGYLPFGVECAVITAWICPALVEPGEDPA